MNKRIISLITTGGILFQVGVDSVVSIEGVSSTHEDHPHECFYRIVYKTKDAYIPFHAVQSFGVEGGMLRLRDEAYQRDYDAGLLDSEIAEKHGVKTADIAEWRNGKGLVRNYRKKSEEDEVREATAVTDPQGGIEAFDYIKEKLTPEEFVGYCKGSFLKHVILD